MKNKYYADAYGPDLNALIACVKKAFEIAECCGAGDSGASASASDEG